MPFLVGDFVWRDNDQDGVQDGDEPGIPGACMNLVDSSGARIDQTVTDSNRLYAFNTSTGEYTVEVCPDNFTAPAPVGTIGDFIWLDINRDGIQDAGEPGLSNVRVNLFEAGGDLTPGGGDDVFIGRRITNVNGRYVFNDLPPGTCFVDVIDSSVPLGLNLSVGPQSETDPSATRTITAAGETLLDVDFGYGNGNTTAIIGDYVWIDANGDGIQDDNEPGIDGVTLDLIDLGADGLPGGVGADACGGDTSGYVKDHFSTVSFGNNDGSRDWSGNWVEVDPRRNGPARGSVKVYGGKLYLGVNPYSGDFPSAAREVDLCASTSATFVGRKSARSTKSYNISAFTSANTRVRFRVANKYGGSAEYFKVTWIKITSN